MGGGSYSETWANSIRGKYQTGEYSTGSYNMGRYAKYDEPIDAKKSIIPLINQYIKKKSEIQNCRLSKKHEELFAIIKELLDTLKGIDKQQAEILIEKYEQLLKEYKKLLEENKEDKLDEINKKYMGLLNGKLPNIELKLKYNHEVDFLLRLDYFIQWLDETLKNYKLYPEDQEYSKEKIGINIEQTTTKKSLFFRRHTKEKGDERSRE